VPNYSYNPSNELTSNSSGSYAYDANGNTLTDASGKSYTWDFENRLVQAIVPGSGGGTTTFKYDPFGRRIQKSGPLGTTNYLYDGSNSMEEVDRVATYLPAMPLASRSTRPWPKWATARLSDLRSLARESPVHQRQFDRVGTL
jgi:YD repeat-containing protein